MASNGFLAQKPASKPLSFGAVLMLHGAVIAAVVLLKGPAFVRPDPGTLTTTNIEIDKPPPPDPLPQPDQPKPSPATLSSYDLPPTLVPPVAPTTSATPSPPVTTAEIGKAITPPQIPFVRPEPERLVEVPIRRPPPVRVDAQFDPRFADALQPPYPAAEQRAEREGTVQLRVRISPAGRVVAAERISATSDAFWRVTERQALSRWRFKPATVDGRPVESSKVLSLRFQLDGR